MEERYTARQLSEKLGYHRVSINNINKRYQDKGGIPGAKRIGHMWTFTEESAEFIKGLKPGRKLGSKNGNREMIKG